MPCNMIVCMSAPAGCNCEHHRRRGTAASRVGMAHGNEIAERISCGADLDRGSSRGYLRVSPVCFPRGTTLTTVVETTALLFVHVQQRTQLNL